MSQALYRTYRPQQFADVISQEHIKLTLQNQLKSQQVAHAYLFSGPRGVGKTTLARIFARAVNDVSDQRNYVDIIEIDAASHTGVDNVRDNIIQNAYVSPAQLPYKVFIIDEVHMLSGSAFNALLKILEEPPSHVIFILATTEVHRLPATVVSRCQRFDFHAIRLPELIKRLQWLCAQEKVVVDDAVLERIARKAQGAVRDAESMLGQILAIGEERITIEQADVVLPRVDMAVAVELFSFLVARQGQAYLQGVSKAAETGIQMKELWQLLLELFRRGLLYSVNQSLTQLEDLDVHASTHEQLIALLSQLAPADYLKLIEIFTTAGELYSKSPIAQLIIEVPGLEWCVGSQAVQAVAAPTTPTPTLKPIAPGLKPTPTKASMTTGQSKPVLASSPLRTNRPVNADLLTALKQQWPAVLHATKEFNHALAMALSVAHLAGAYQPNTVELGFRYDFHRNRVSELANLKAIQTIISQLLGQEVLVVCVVGEQFDIEPTMLNAMPSDNIAKVNPLEVDNVWDLALEAVGGKEVKTKSTNTSSAGF